jgi:hypothetical protein
MDFFRPPFLSARLISYLGTKAAPLLGSGNRGRAILSVSYRNVSAALSHLNKVVCAGVETFAG